MELTFTVPGEPRGKGRPRFGRTKTGRPIVFTDAQTASYENLVALTARAAMAGAAPIDGPVTLDLTVRMTPPASASRKARASMLAGLIAPTRKPDLDNVAKAVLDGLNAIAFRDDVLVVEQTSRKVFSETAGLDVVLRPYRPAQYAHTREGAA